jgi:hypothetical protein
MAKGNNGFDEEPSDVGDSSLKDSSPVKRSSAYQKLRRDLSEDELNNPGAQKMILSDLDRLESEVEDLKCYKDRFHEKDKENAIKDELLNTSTSKEILYAVAISLGATLIGLSPSLWFVNISTNQINYGIIILVFGVILIFGGLITKFFTK